MSSSNKNIYLISREIKKEIMATDIFIGVPGEAGESGEVIKTIEHCFSMFRDFENRFSRFIKNNELTLFNSTSGIIEVSEDLYRMLEISLDYYEKTGGLFDISIYPALLTEGYVISSTKGFLGPHSDVLKNLESFEKLELMEDHKVRKPQGLTIELGGIGKGYIIEKVSSYLKKYYRNFVVDAGGDIYYSGKDLANGYDFWACDIENPHDKNNPLATLMLTDKAVATSGINRRSWVKEGKIKNHLIDSRTGKSVSNGIISSTVISESITDADIMAKTLLLMGCEKGLKYAEDNDIGVLFLNEDGRIISSTIMDQYVYKE